jgi:acyl-CoA thioesterase-1
MATASPAMTSRSISCRIASVLAPFGTTLDRPAAFTMKASIDWVMLLRLLVTWLMCLPLTAWAGGTILVYGDSLSAAYGLAQDAGWPTLLQARLTQKRMDYTVTNASISGETTSGGAARIAEALKTHQPKVVIVALGANDGLRGLAPAQMRANLAQIVRASQKAKCRVLLVGMRLPPNYGEAYTRPFAQVYIDLAREYKTALAPFLLEGMAERRELFQSDNMHPTAAAQPIILDNIWKALAPMLK